jgi:diguanylate cyclase (GGDEF)-like protein/PAS domain S-box-containing protein
MTEKAGELEGEAATFPALPGVGTGKAAPDGGSGGFLEMDYTALLAALPVAFLIKDSSGRIIFVNKACEAYFGFAFEDLCSAGKNETATLGQLAIFQGDDEEVFRNRAVIEIDHSFVDPISKERRYAHTIKRPIHQASGKPHFILCITIDVTEQKKVEDGLRASKEKLRGLYELSPLGIALTSMEGRYIEFNDAFERICGYTQDELNRLDYWSLTPREYAAAEEKQLESLKEKGCYGPYEKEYIKKSGERVPLRLNGVLVTGSDGKPYIWSIVEDVAERKRKDESLYLGALIFRSSGEGILVADADEKIVDVNPAFSRLLGFSGDEVKGAKFDIIGLGLQGRGAETLAEALRGQERCEFEIWATRKDGRRVALSVMFSVTRNKDGDVFRYIMQFLDITERKKKDETIWRQANFDALTELPNRRLFYERLKQEVNRAERHGGRVALLFIDLDRFKEANDSLGHHAGDQVLIETAERVRRCVRAVDSVARLGGDEFTVILTQFDDKAEIDEAAARINQEISAPYAIGDKNIYLSASIGITIYPDDAQDVESLLKRSDLAMYQAKYEGRNRFTHYTHALQQKADERLSLTNDLAYALKRGELEVFYQPIVELASGRFAKAEALLRWRHPQRGLVSPAEFIPIAEESGLILDIGDWVLNEVAAAALRWSSAFSQTIQVAANVSPVQFAEHARVLQWLHKLALLGLPPKALALEFTEGFLIQECSRVQEQIAAFRNIGVEISIDDFGTGFSSLSYLKRFDIDTLKIDRSFVRDLAEDETDRALSEAIILMAKKLGIKTVAEGVETERQRELLEGFGCDYAQGYLFARPMPVDAFEALLIEKIGTRPRFANGARP